MFVCRSQFQILVGGHSLSASNDGSVTVLTSSKVVHSGYNTQTLQNDIAVLKFPNPVTLGGEQPS